MSGLIVGCAEPEAVVPPAPPPIPQSPEPEPPPPAANCVLTRAGAYGGAPLKPGDLVGAITNESGITSRELGAITITPSSSMVEVAGPVSATVLKAMKGKTIRGETFDVKVLKRTT